MCYCIIMTDKTVEYFTEYTDGKTGRRHRVEDFIEYLQSRGDNIAQVVRVS